MKYSQMTPEEVKIMQDFLNRNFFEAQFGAASDGSAPADMIDSCLLFESAEITSEEFDQLLSDQESTTYGISCWDGQHDNNLNLTKLNDGTFMVRKNLRPIGMNITLEEALDLIKPKLKIWKKQYQQM